MFYRRRRKVAYYSEEPNDSSFRFRVYNMAAALNDADIDVSASWFYRSDERLLEDVFTSADVVVVHRSRYTAELDHLIGLARRKGIPVLFDCDDLVFDPTAIPLLLRSLAQQMSWDGRDLNPWDIWHSIVSRLRATAELCDGFIGSTAVLANEAATVLGRPAAVVPNFLSTEELSYSDKVVAARDVAGRLSDGRIHLGYFSGSPTHVRDLGIAAEALRKVLASRRDVVVRIAGYMSIIDAGLEGFESQVEEVPFTDYVNLHRVMAETEVNIAPLQDNRFTRCKSELKWFDAGIVAIPTLASPTTSMASAVHDGVDALLVADDDWADALIGVLDDYDGFAKAVGVQARETALSRYQPHQNVGAILSALELA